MLLIDSLFILREYRYTHCTFLPPNMFIIGNSSAYYSKVENNINIISKRENIKREKNKPMLEHTYSPEDWQAVYTPIEDLDF